MSGDRALEPAAPLSQESDRDTHLATEPREIGGWPLDRPFPAVLRDRDLMLVLGLKHSRYAIRKKAGEFIFLHVRPQLPTGPTLYSGSLVRAWVRGELGESRYFLKGRQAAVRHGSPTVVGASASRLGKTHPREWDSL